MGFSLQCSAPGWEGAGCAPTAWPAPALCLAGDCRCSANCCTNQDVQLQNTHRHTDTTAGTTAGCAWVAAGSHLSSTAAAQGIQGTQKPLDLSRTQSPPAQRSHAVVGDAAVLCPASAGMAAPRGCCVEQGPANSQAWTVRPHQGDLKGEMGLLQ